MKPRFYLKELLKQGEGAITAASAVLAQRMVTLDCSEVEAIAPEQMNALFSAIPESWDFADFASAIDDEDNIFDIRTFSDSFADQLLQYLDQRHGRTSPEPEAEPSPSIVEVEVPATSESAVALHPIRVLERVTQEYSDYLQSEFRAKDPGLKAALESALTQPLFLAQEPFFQAHRPFKVGQRWKDLPIDSRLANALQQRSRSDAAYLHQSEAIAHLLGSNASPLVVTTGTGSGKTETFLVPVIQNAIADAIRYKKSGLTAILVYPMNALANDQLLRINDYLDKSGWSGSVSVAQYDRGTNQAQRQALRQNPPHILLTNYMMLEYLLVRPADRDGIFANHRCKFLVLDEVHTYRGTLGSNIALLVRRLRSHLAQARQDWRSSVPDDERSLRYPPLLPVGTSATIKSVTDPNLSQAERIRLRDEAVQDFFSKLTGVQPNTIKVIGEELEAIHVPHEAAYPSLPAAPEEVDVTDQEAVRKALCLLGGQPSDTSLEKAAQRTKLLWDLNSWLIRSPMSLSQIIERVRSEVSERQQCDETAIHQEVEAALVVGAALPDDAPGALRLRSHRLIRGGWRFHRCLSPQCGKLYPMGEDYCVCGCRTAPLYLCRNCGADYLRFTGEDPRDPAQGILTPNASATDEHEWMLYEPQRHQSAIDLDDDDADEPETSVASKNRKRTEQIRKRPIVRGSFDPQTLSFSSDETDYPLKVTLSPARTRCLCCGGTAGSRNVITPVALGTSAAVKVLGEGLVEALAEAHEGQPGHDGKERLLIFSDSRQDAAHQARFIIFASRFDRMRRLLVKLLEQKGPLSLQRAVTLLKDAGIQEQDNPYVPANTSWIPDETQQRIEAWEEAPLLDEIAVNAGYRASLINLGLVRVNYHRLDEYIQACGTPVAQQLGISLTQLEYLCRCLLDEMRVRGCLSRDLLRYHPAHPSFPTPLRAAEWERKMKQPSGYPINKSGDIVPFLDGVEVPSGINLRNAWRRPKSGGRSPSLQNLLEHLLKRFGGIPEVEDTHLMSVLNLLLEPGKFLIATELFGTKQKTPLLQVNAESVQLQLIPDPERLRCQTCGTPFSGQFLNYPCAHCQGKLVLWSAQDALSNRMVERVRSEKAVPLIAGEHTAQIPNQQRVKLEEDFKAHASQSKTNTLACSPTLEMGIDVGGLDAVVLRNVPPRPDNYAQRGGRAGRRTRVGLVITYARSTPHDQYFYDKPAEMISGEVPAPALALGNRDVITRHLNAIAFGAADPGLAGRMLDYVSKQGEVNQETVNALITGVQDQFSHAIDLACHAWESTVLTEAGLTREDLQTSLEKLPQQIQDVINRTAYQVQQLRTAVKTFYEDLDNERAAIQASDLINRLLGAPKQNAQSGDADDRSSGYPLRRFAEFGILPGYEFPTQPASLRLLRDEHEDDPVTVARRFGINQFRPNAQVYARTKRWRVIGLDTASPWNPRAGDPGKQYRICRTCGLRFDANEPSCRRCKDDAPGKAIPAAEYAGFIARRDEGPILDEEERYAARDLITTHPQWNGDITGRWVTSTGWTLRLSREEEVYWLNEGLPPTSKEQQSGIPVLHSNAKGYNLCGFCGRMLNDPEPDKATNKGRKATTPKQTDAYGHAEGCPQRSTPPRPVAIATMGKAEVLRLLVPVPSDIKDDRLKQWGLSLGYSLKAGIQHRYMLDGSEIEFELEEPWQTQGNQARYSLVALTFIDPSLGGSGYLRRIANEFHLVAQQALEHLDHPGCETACYRCLKTYQNQRFHDLLEWARIVPDLEALSQTAPVSQPGQLGDIFDPQPWLEAYAAGVGSPLELKFLRLFEQHHFHPQKQVPITLKPGDPPISVPDFAIPERRIAIYIDGAAFHKGINLRRDRFIRNKLRDADWRVVELRSLDLSRGDSLVQDIQSL